MTNERAKSELEQLYMSLSEEKKKALDVAFKAMEQAIPVMYYPQVDGITPTVVAQADGEKTCGTCRNEDTYHCAECENKSDYEQSQADGEYISRQAVMDCYKKWQPYMATKLHEFEKELSELPSVAIPSAEPKTEWVPVSERLPEDKQSVLVWCSQYKNIYCAYLEKKQWWIFGAFIQIVPNEVVAWMPLPKPYEPQESEDKE